MTAQNPGPLVPSCTAQCAGLNMKELFVPPVVIPIVLILAVLVSALMRYA